MTGTTMFLPAERADASRLERQRELVNDRLFRESFDRSPNMMLVLNSDRQVILYNPAVARFLEGGGELDGLPVFGRRAGEAFRCIHSDTFDGGCGTSEACSACGVTKAILSGQAGREVFDECRLTIRHGGMIDSLDLKVQASPITIGAEQFTIVYLVDIGEEKRRKALERIFFHDVLNTAGNLSGVVHLLTVETNPEQVRKFLKILDRNSQRLVDEIKSQRELLAAESGELRPEFTTISTKAFLDDLCEQYCGHDVARGRTLIIAPDCADLFLRTDVTLLGRIIGNMTKNALEAAGEGQTVTLSVRPTQIARPARNDSQKAAEFTVHNPSIMPRNVQLQVFQRSFSTKSKDRGLGTYSMKLLSERYLKGTVSFDSSETRGTTFYARYPLTITAEGS